MSSMESSYEGTCRHQQRDAFRPQRHSANLEVIIP